MNDLLTLLNGTDRRGITKGHCCQNIDDVFPLLNGNESWNREKFRWQQISK